MAILVMLSLPLFGRGMLAGWARQKATSHLNSGAITTSQQWLDRAIGFDPHDGRTDLLRAACFRRLQEVDRFVEALESARRKGAPNERVRQEFTLGQIHAGSMEQRPELQLIALIEQGLSTNEVATAFVAGFLVRGEPEEARKVLDAWSADRPGEPDAAYMNGVYRHWTGQLGQAEAELEKALTWQPRHELAHSLLAELLEQQDRIEDAYQQHHQWATRFPTNPTARAGLARLLRKAGHGDQARLAIHRFALDSEPSPLIAAEMGQLELNSGNYVSALRWFGQIAPDQFQQRNVAYEAATAMALADKHLLAERVFTRADAEVDRRRRTADLQERLVIAPDQSEAATDEIARLSASQTETADIYELLKAADQEPPPASTAGELYAVHCSACHGTRGDGNGLATRHLFPRPLNLRGGRFRLASTDNGVATVQDIAATIRRGIPGTSMPSFEHLGEAAIQLVVEETLRLHREGVEEQLLVQWRSQGEELDEDALRSLVDLRTTPGKGVPVPVIGSASAEAVARGRNTYFRLGCQHCHGEDGSGALHGPMFDDQGLPAPPRDLVHDPFKGGQEPESIYWRLFVGMPGTLHPGSSTVPDNQLVDLVQFVRWLSREPKRSLTNFQRFERAWRRASVAASGPD